MESLPSPLAEDSKQCCASVEMQGCEYGHLEGVGQLDLKLQELIQRCTSFDILQRALGIYFASHKKSDRRGWRACISAALAHQHQLAFLYHNIGDLVTWSFLGCSTMWSWGPIEGR